MQLLLFSISGQLQDLLVYEVLRKLRSSIDFERFTYIKIVIFKEYFSFINFTFKTQK